MPAIHVQSDNAKALLADALGRAVRGDTRPAIEMLLRVQDKRGKLVPLKLNPAQEAYWMNRSPADIILKAAQLGMTTVVQADFFMDALFVPGIEVLYLAQRDETARKLFTVTQRFFRSLPEALRPETEQDTRNSLVIKHANGAESSIMVGSAESKTFGRGRPVHRALFTEVGFYGKDVENVVKGIIARMPYGNSRHVYESTANGQAGMFYESWIAAGNGGNSLNQHFYPWCLDPYNVIPFDDTKWGAAVGDLTDEEQAVGERLKLSEDQIRWRRWRIAELGPDFFKQENPETPDEAFLPVGSAVFDYRLLDRLAKFVRPPVRSSPDRKLDLWRFKELGRPYIVCIDQSSGEQRDINFRPTDWQVASVWDTGSLTTVATFRAHCTMKELAAASIKLARYYKDALIVPERNLAQFGLSSEIHDQYPGVYQHLDGKLGYPMNKATKPVLKDNFESIISVEGACTIYSTNLIHEARNYRFLGDGVGYRAMGAAPGGHDDELVTAFFAFDPEVRRQSLLLGAGRPGRIGAATATSRNRRRVAT